MKKIALILVLMTMTMVSIAQSSTCSGKRHTAHCRNITILPIQNDRSMLEIIRDILVSVSAIATMGLALPGLNKWRKEISTRTEYELARRLVKAAYRTRDAFGHIRNPIVSAWEYPSEYDPTNQDPIARFNASMSVYNKRWEHINLALEELNTEVLEAEVLFGQEPVDARNKLRQLANRLSHAIRRNLEILDLNKDEDYKGEEESMREMVYAGWNDEGKFSTELENEIKKFEKIAQPYIARLK